MYIETNDYYAAFMHSLVFFLPVVQYCYSACFLGDSKMEEEKEEIGAPSPVSPKA